MKKRILFVMAALNNGGAERSLVNLLREFDLEFSQKWLTLWKWYCVIIAGMIVSTLVVLISFLLAALLILAFTIGTAVIAIVQLVYLYKMAKLFRQYA